MEAKKPPKPRTRIKEVVERVEPRVEDHPKLRKRVRKVINEMRTKEVSKLLEEALMKYYESDELKPYQGELIKLQQHIEERGQKLIILFDGRDASGKGGTIRRVARYMNEKRYSIVALGKPSERQRTELHIKRYIEQFPQAGEIVLFDRSWYNRAMVEPVMGFCTPAQYKRFMNKVVSYEENFISDRKTVLIKLYFSVSKNEQQRRFERRLNDPLRQWKLSEVDLQAQDLWEEFTEKKFRLLKKTHTERTPWYVIRSDDKHLARLETMKLILNSVRYRGRSRRLDFKPNPEVLIPGDEEIKIMERQRRRTGKFEN